MSAFAVSCKLPPQELEDVGFNPNLNLRLCMLSRARSTSNFIPNQSSSPTTVAIRAVVVNDSVNNIDDRYDSSVQL